MDPSREAQRDELVALWDGKVQRANRALASTQRIVADELVFMGRVSPLSGTRARQAKRVVAATESLRAAALDDFDAGRPVLPESVGHRASRQSGTRAPGDAVASPPVCDVDHEP
jgi:hypothetical protein